MHANGGETTTQCCALQGHGETIHHKTPWPWLCGVILFHSVLDAFSDPTVRDAFNPLGNLFSIGQVEPAERIVVDVGGHQNVVIAPNDRRHALLLDVQPGGDVCMRFLEDEIRNHARYTSS